MGRRVVLHPGAAHQAARRQRPALRARAQPSAQELQRIARRPVNFQATANIILFARDVLLGQPYYTIIEPEEADKAETTGATAAYGEADAAHADEARDLGGAAGEGA